MNGWRFPMDVGAKFVYGFAPIDERAHISPRKPENLTFHEGHFFVRMKKEGRLLTSFYKNDKFS